MLLQMTLFHYFYIFHCTYVCVCVCACVCCIFFIHYSDKLFAV